MRLSDNEQQEVVANVIRYAKTDQSLKKLFDNDEHVDYNKLERIDNVFQFITKVFLYLAGITMYGFFFWFWLMGHPYKASKYFIVAILIALVFLILATVIGFSDSLLENNLRANMSDKLQASIEDNRYNWPEFGKDTVFEDVVGKNEAKKFQYEVTFSYMVCKSGTANKIIENSTELVSLVNTLTDLAGKRYGNLTGYQNGKKVQKARYEYDITKMNTYASTKEKILKDLAETEHQIEQQIIEPETTKIVKRILQHPREEQLNILPDRIHKEYADTLIKHEIQND